LPKKHQQQKDNNKSNDSTECSLKFSQHKVKVGQPFAEELSPAVAECTHRQGIRFTTASCCADCFGIQLPAGNSGKAGYRRRNISTKHRTN
jgi:hypothetical protein